MLTLALLLTPAMTVEGALPCERALAVTPGMSCVATGHGVAVAGTPEDAERLAGYARAGEARFEATFGRGVPSYAVFASPPVPDRAAAKAAGFDHVLAWPSGTAFERATREGIERGARAFAASQNMTTGQTDQVVTRALANQPDSRVRAAMEASIVSHELGHLWFTSTFWPDAQGSAEGVRPHYGGPGPDWLDEAAAIQMEDEATATLRRGQFRSLMRGETVASIGAVDGRAILINATGLLSREHPGLESLVGNATRASAMANGGIVVSYSPAVGGPQPDAQVSIFYLHTQVFTEYLVEKSGTTDILSRITLAIARGQTFEAWLANDGAALGLAGTVAGLQSDWAGYADEV
jgi:hypothetical protein